MLWDPELELPSFWAGYQWWVWGADECGTEADTYGWDDGRAGLGHRRTDAIGVVVLTQNVLMRICWIMHSYGVLGGIILSSVVAY
jgi:hypothetical protein